MRLRAAQPLSWIRACPSPKPYCCVVGIILKTGETILEKISFRATLMLRAGAGLGIVGGPERKGARFLFWQVCVITYDAHGPGLFP